MMKVKIEFGNVRIEEIADCLEEFSEYKIWLYDDRVFAYFKVKSISDLKKLTEELELRRIEYKCHRIEKVESWLRKLIRFNLLKN
jgi:hypothetical protein